MRYSKMKSISKQTQKLITSFISSKSEYNNQNKQQKQLEHQKQQQKPQKQKMVNVEFYRNQRTSQPNGEYIEKIYQEWYNNFALLERHHGFIQWLFPNSYASRFNQKSAPLSAQEEKIFRSDINITKRYVMSYQMMLHFYGMKLKNKKTGEIVRARDVNYKERYKATFLNSFHNHMRITRILCSLTMIGFGRYAKQLSLFLNEQIHGENGELKLLAKYNVDKDWKQYMNYVESFEDLNVYLRQYKTQNKQQSQSSEKETKIVEQKQGQKKRVKQNQQLDEEN